MKSYEKNIYSKKIIVLVFFIILVITIYEIIHIYAVFHSEMTGTAEFQNGKWNIYINGTKISTGVTTSFVIDQYSVDSSTHVATGKIAPGLSGSFDIVINPSDTDVSVKYDISLDQENMTNDNLKITGITETSDGNQLTRTDENTYTGVIPLQKIKNGITNNVRVYVEWEDVDANNDQDIDLGASTNHVMQIPITVHAIQYLGETITEYVENTGS